MLALEVTQEPRRSNPSTFCCFVWSLIHIIQKTRFITLLTAILRYFYTSKTAKFIEVGLRRCTGINERGPRR